MHKLSYLLNIKPAVPHTAAAILTFSVLAMLRVAILVLNTLAFLTFNNLLRVLIWIPNIYL